MGLIGRRKPYSRPTIRFGERGANSRAMWSVAASISGCGLHTRTNRLLSEELEDGSFLSDHVVFLANGDRDTAVYIPLTIARPRPRRCPATGARCGHNSLVGAVLVGVAFGASALLFKLFGHTSGLDKLAALYPATSPPEGPMYRRQWMAVGPVYYKNSADISVGPRGLYVWVRPFLAKYDPVLIPWTELRDPRGAILYWQRAVRLTVGNPQVTTLVFTEWLFREMSSFLHARGSERYRGPREEPAAESGHFGGSQ